MAEGNAGMAHEAPPEIETLTYGCAVDFLKALRLSDPRWLPAEATRSRWAFRGHRDASWPLIPSAWRFGPDDPLSVLKAQLDMKLAPRLRQDRARLLDDPLPVLPKLRERDDLPARIDLVITQALAEHQAVQHFLDLANEMGLSIPAYPSTVDRLLDDASPPRLLPWIAGPAFGLAQHYGVPTRLLDWTRNPLVAAFFAADEAIEHDDADTLAVWAFEAIPRGMHTLVVVEEYPHYGNPSLHAQHGLFTYVRDAHREYLRYGHWVSIDMVPGVLLRKLMLPTSEAEHLLRLLHAEHYSRVHLFPGYASVAQTARRWWRVHKRPIP